MATAEIKWSGPSYNVFRRNCCHFADEVCEILGVGNIPEWTYRLANIGSTAAEVIRVLDAPGLLPLSYSHANTAPPAVADAPAIARDTSEHMNV
ncbi:desi2 [Symbiodinium sp. CCMP2592]|nr:desi2 [Symbiodinium sp. CCMP2592]